MPSEMKARGRVGGLAPVGPPRSDADGAALRGADDAERRGAENAVSPGPVAGVRRSEPPAGKRTAAKVSRIGVFRSATRPTSLTVSANGAAGSSATVRVSGAEEATLGALTAVWHGLLNGIAAHATSRP